MMGSPDGDFETQSFTGPEEELRGKRRMITLCVGLAVRHFQAMPHGGELFEADSLRKKPYVWPFCKPGPINIFLEATYGYCPK